MTAPGFSPFSSGGSSGGVGNGNALLVFGASNLTGTTTDRFLSPGYIDGVASTVAVSLRVTRKGTLKNVYVEHNTPNGNGNDIVYTIRKNNVSTAVGVSLSSTGASASNTATQEDFAVGDLLDVIATKAVSIGNGQVGAVVSMEFA